MNNLKIVFYIGLILLTGCNQSPTPSQPHSSQSELTITEAAHRFIASQANLLNTKYNMKSGGFGTSLYDGVKELSWNFDIPRKFTKDEGRAIVMDCIAQIVRNANNNPELKNFFNNEGFTQKNVDIVLIAYPKEQEVYYPETRTVSFHSNKLGFHTNDPSIEYGYYTSEYESYEDAVAILKIQGREDVILGSEFTVVNHECK